MKSNPNQKYIQAKTVHYVIVVGALCAGVGMYFVLPPVFSMTYNIGGEQEERIPEVPTDDDKSVATTSPDVVVEEKPKPTFPEHIDTPDAVKAVYMTSCAAATPSFRTHLMNLIAETELNSIVIDVKDYSGGISFLVDDPQLKPAMGQNCFVPDMKAFVELLHEQDIYVIARITVFQDPFYAPRHPGIAVQRADDGGVWRDYKGLAYLDPGSQQVWDYTVSLAKESYNIGFDELNFDYIRFPSDGNLKNARYPVSGNRPKDVVLEEFFQYLNNQLKAPEAFPDQDEPVISADIFGMTTTNYDHLNIGQVLERTIPYFDYVAPMVYPSHYPNGFNGWSNPNLYPHEVVKYSMTRAVQRVTATTTRIKFIGAQPLSTSTPYTYVKPSFDPNVLRPWLQDFDYGGDYGPAEVRTQIEATYDSGLNSWMLWDPANRYTREALNATTTPRAR